MLPLIGAIAAGNAAVLKPSELSPATSKLLASLLPQYLDPDCYAVVEGAIPESTALLAQPFDLVFFTGSTVVGRIVMRAAAEHLTPVVLELGGKSPTYVDETARLDVAVRRITFGRFSNCGQTCVAPDYILVKRDVEEAFLEEMQRCLRNFFGDNPRESDSFGRVISARHWRRLVDLISADGLDIVTGGPDTADEADLYIPPTIIRNCDPNAAVMQEEIFGPILPVIVVDSQEEAEKFIRERPKPLAAYMFSSDSARIEQFLFRTYAGMTSVNDVGVNALNQHLPFGGVGASGIGGYHGKYSFDVFSHKRAVLWRSDAGILDVPQRYPPYTESKATFLRRIGAIQHCVEWCSAKTYVKLLLALFVLGLIALILFLVGIF